jgi:hypothetical protein
MKRLKQIIIKSNQQVRLAFIDTSGIPAIPQETMQVHTSDPEIAMMQGDRLVPTGRKLGRVKVFMIEPPTLTVLDTHLLQVVAPEPKQKKKKRIRAK